MTELNSTCTAASTIIAKSATLPDILAATKLLEALAAQQPFLRGTLYVREIPNVQALEDVRQGGALLGFPVKVDEALPATVKDKDGNEVELLGLMMTDCIGEIIRTGRIETVPRMVFMTGKIVKAKVQL